MKVPMYLAAALMACGAAGAGSAPWLGTPWPGTVVLLAGVALAAWVSWLAREAGAAMGWAEQRTKLLELEQRVAAHDARNLQSMAGVGQMDSRITTLETEVRSIRNLSAVRGTFGG